jgi:hypothetical protein
MLLNRELTDLRDGDHLNVIMKSTFITVDPEKKYSGNYLFIKKIGIGGFSKVYEGIPI